MSEQIIINYISETEELSFITCNSNKIINLNPGSSVSLSKLDLTLSKYTLPEFIVPITNYDNINNKFNTPYSIIIKTIDNNNNIITNLYNFQLDYNNKVEVNNNIVNNFNDYFKINFTYFFTLINKFIVESVKNSLETYITPLTINQYKLLTPSFESNNDNIKYYILANNNASNTIRFYLNDAELDNDKNIGSYSIYFNEDLNNLLFREWETNYTMYNNIKYYSLLSNLKLNMELDNIKVQINNNLEDYYITNYISNKFYEYNNYIRSILVVIDGLGFSLSSLPQENNSYNLINNNTDINNDLSILSILQLDTVDRGLYRLSYSNPNQLNNSVIINNNNKFTRFTMKLFYIDKYGNIKRMKFYKYDSLTAVICFNL